MRNSPPWLAWSLIVAGIVMVAYAWQVRQPLTTADFTLFYRSAQQPASRMYEPPPGPPRNNMNPPQFQLLLRPLTVLPLAAASAVFRAISIACLCGCVWWLARASSEPWDAADFGALLAWAPMAAMLSLNQVAWVLWPPLVAAWWWWRRDRWIPGAIALGIALSFKPFLGVLWLWLLVSGRWRAAAAAGAATALTTGIGLFAGIDAFRAWLAALGQVRWWWVAMNASLEGCLARLLTEPGAQTVTLPPAVAPLSAVGATAIVVITLWRTRRRSVDDSWPALVSASLLASPLGWMYYAWWMLPGTRPMRVLTRAPMLWIPIAYVAFPQTNRYVAATVGSAYFWGVFAVWLSALFEPTRTPADAGIMDRAKH